MRVPLFLSASFVALGCWTAPLTPRSDAPSPPPLEALELDALDDLPAEELFADVGARFEVPPDLLEAAALVTSALAPRSREDAPGWFGLPAARIDAASAYTGLSTDRLQADRAGETVAAAALLDQARGDGHPAEIDGAWWPALASLQGLDGDAGDRFAGEVFEVLQRGFVAPTADLPFRDQPDVVSAAPAATGPLPELPPPGLGDTPEYPLAARSQAAPRGASRALPVRRVVLRATEASWAEGIAGDTEPSVHYLVRRSDGEVTQLAWEDAAIPGAADDAVVIGLAAPSVGFGGWTPPLLEGAARLTAYLTEEHGLAPDAVGGAPGERFPWGPWLDTVACFRTRSDCAVPAGAPVDAPAPSDDAERSAGRSGSVPSVPYFYQYANALHPSASCQNTSIAMVLAWLGWSGTPDTITGRFGKNLAQSPEGLAQVFNTLAAEAGFTARLTPRRDGTVEGLRALLDAGKPVIVHGYMTGYGHVVTALGWTGSEYIVNDPAGRWTQTFKGGYPYGWSATAGRKIRYGRAAFEQAVATSNGSTYLPLWYHELSSVDDAPTEDAPPAEAEPEESDAPASLPEDGAATGGGETTGPYAWASVRFTEPTHGEAAPNPLSLRAVRHGGHVTEFWAGPHRLAEPTPGNPAGASARLHVEGPRELTAKNISRWGTLLATHTITVDVGGAPPAEGGTAECAVVGTLSCGGVVTGDTSSPQASSAIGGYPDIVGNYAGPELGYTWTSTVSGPVEIGFRDARPMEYDLDIVILEQQAGVCAAADQVARVFTSGTFEARAGAAYTFVVDGFSGDSGAFTLELDCR